MKILLAYSSGSSKRCEDSRYTDLLPTGLCSIHSFLCSNGINSHLANLSHFPDARVRKLLTEFRPDIVGLSQWTHNRFVTIDIARTIKSMLPDCTVIAGGGHATHQYSQILSRNPEIDLIITGEGEHALLEVSAAIHSGKPLSTIPGLAIRLDGKPFHTGYRERIKDLDSLPYPSIFLKNSTGLDIDLQAEFITTSRGCPSVCRFCGSPDFWGRNVTYRTPASVVDEFLFLKDKLGLIYLSIRDETFTANRKRTIELCKIMIKRRVNIFWNCQSRVESVDPELLELMKQAGCECIQLGVESGARPVLERLGKRITPEQVIKAAEAAHKAGISLSVYLITGVPSETPADEKATVELMKRIRPDSIQASPLAYYPGTALFRDAVKNRQLSEDIFNTNRAEAIIAQKDGYQRVDRIISKTSSITCGISPKRAKALKRETGYSAVRGMQLGDFHAQHGDFSSAEAEYLEITQKEPDHPWGWFLLAELYNSTGRITEGHSCYRRVLELVPNNRQSLLALKKQPASKKLGGP